MLAHKARKQMLQSVYALFRQYLFVWHAKAQVINAYGVAFWGLHSLCKPHGWGWHYGVIHLKAVK